MKTLHRQVGGTLATAWYDNPHNEWQGRKFPFPGDVGFGCAILPVTMTNDHTHVISKHHVQEPLRGSAGWRDKLRRISPGCTWSR